MCRGDELPKTRGESIILCAGLPVIKDRTWEQVLIRCLHSQVSAISTNNLDLKCVQVYFPLFINCLVGTVVWYLLTANIQIIKPVLYIYIYLVSACLCHYEILLQQLLASNYQLPTNNYQLTTNNYPLTTIH